LNRTSTSGFSSRTGLGQEISKSWPESILEGEGCAATDTPAETGIRISRPQSPLIHIVKRFAALRYLSIKPDGTKQCITGVVRVSGSSDFCYFALTALEPLICFANTTIIYPRKPLSAYAVIDGIRPDTNAKKCGICPSICLSR
jgi:hypothetical protein